MENVNNQYKIKEGFLKFKDSPFREHQEDAITAGVDKRKKVSVLCLPTGAGKSLIGCCAAMMSGDGIYMVHSKPLQIQLHNDFPELPILWGRSNYPCNYRQDGTGCDVCVKCHLKSNGCAYHYAKEAAVKAPVSILNYEYWITEANYVGRFSGSELIVVDEADSLEMTISKFTSLTFSEGVLKGLGMGLPKYKTVSTENGLRDWVAWAKDVRNRVFGKLRKAEAELKDRPDDADKVKKVETLTGHINKLGMFIDNVDQTWIMDVNEYGVKTVIFRPTWITPELAKKYVWRHGDRFLLMSATFPPVIVLAKILGLDMKDIRYEEFPSTFPVENRPVVIDPVVNMTYKDMDSQYPVLRDKIKDIMKKHKDEKGVVHCVSYKIRDEIMKIGDPRLISHNGQNKIEMIKVFRESNLPYVFVSPSSERGISLEDDKCRFVIWAKAPFLNLTDKLVSSRVYGSGVGKLWYRSDMLQTVVQGCGRAVRSDTDYAVSYLLDQQIVKCLSENVGFVPRWWRDAI